MEWLSLYLLGSVAMVASALEIAITLLLFLELQRIGLELSSML
jgi:hypothetical protein